MIARVNAYEGPVSPGLAGIRMYEEDALPWLREATGFRGIVVLVDREGERTLAISFWTDAEAERQTEEARRRFGELVAERMGLERDPGRVYEVALAHGVDVSEAT